ncbi:unnamed protein product [Amoebophrya sp. A25]|nr:unnamed protein product [Amoebophrya sp. A25]|eukprot:GSA25T00027663001.1
MLTQLSDTLSSLKDWKLRNWTFSKKLTDEKQELSELKEAQKSLKKDLSNCEGERRGNQVESDEQDLALEENVKQMVDGHTVLDARLAHAVAEAELLKKEESLTPEQLHEKVKAFDLLVGETKDFDSRRLLVSMKQKKHKMLEGNKALEKELQTCRSKAKREQRKFLAAQNLEVRRAEEVESSTARAAEEHAEVQPPAKQLLQEPKGEALELQQPQKQRATQQKIEEKVEGAPSGAPGCCNLRGSMKFMK